VHKIMSGLLDQWRWVGDGVALEMATHMGRYFATRVQARQPSPLLLSRAFVLPWRNTRPLLGGGARNRVPLMRSEAVLAGGALGAEGGGEPLAAGKACESA